MIIEKYVIPNHQIASEQQSLQSELESEKIRLQRQHEREVEDMRRSLIVKREALKVRSSEGRKTKCYKFCPFERQSQVKILNHFIASAICFYV